MYILKSGYCRSSGKFRAQVVARFARVGVSRGAYSWAHISTYYRCYSSELKARLQVLALGTEWSDYKVFLSQITNYLQHYTCNLLFNSRQLSDREASRGPSCSGTIYSQVRNQGGSTPCSNKYYVEYQTSHHCISRTCQKSGCNDDIALLMFR